MTNRIDPDDYDRDGSDEGPEARALDRLIAEAARDYHRPTGAVPRDAMWEAIVAARGARAAAPTAPSAATATVVSLDAARVRRAASTYAAGSPAATPRRSAWAFAAAASLLLAAGVGMGRWWEGHERAAAGSPAVAVTPNDGSRPATPVETRDPAAESAPSLPDALASAEPTTPSDPASTEPRAPRAPRVIAPRPTRPGAPIRRDDGGLAYDVATVRHLTSVEALLVSYRADPLDSLADARVAAWARTLLQDTRLLLDSPAASSRTRRRLFEDLELVLVQMARLAPADSAAAAPTGVRRDREERALIDGTMRDARVLPRLRNAIPAGVGS